MSIVYLNGRFLPCDQAFVSVLDRGFMFGDGVYEVIPAYGGRLFRLQEHLNRLNNSLEAIRLHPPFTQVEWEEILMQLIAANGEGDQSIYMQITRGVAPRDHAFPRDTPPTVFAMSSPFTPPSAEALQKGIAAITLEDIRWKNCNIKSINLLPNVLLRQQALDQGATDAILVRHGLVTEGSASNVFIVKNGTIVTPPKSAFLLPGITRDLILELAIMNNIPCEERSIPVDELQEAEEIWLSASIREVLAVTRLNEHVIGSGEPGPLWLRMFELYQEFKEQIRRGITLNK